MAVKTTRTWRRSAKLSGDAGGNLDCCCPRNRTCRTRWAPIGEQRIWRFSMRGLTKLLAALRPASWISAGRTNIAGRYLATLWNTVYLARARWSSSTALPTRDPFRKGTPLYLRSLPPPFSRSPNWNHRCSILTI